MTTFVPDTSLSANSAPFKFRTGHPGTPLTVSDLARLVSAVAAAPEFWQPTLHIPDPGADRWWTRLHASSAVDVWLLAWLPGHTTQLHDHGPSAAAFTVVQGQLAEVRARPEGTRRFYVRTAGTVTGIAPAVRHDVTGTGTEPAVSIHAYSPPLTEMNYYGAAGELVRTVQSHEPEEELQR